MVKYLKLNTVNILIISLILSKSDYKLRNELTPVFAYRFTIFVAHIIIRTFVRYFKDDTDKRVLVSIFRADFLHMMPLDKWEIHFFKF